MDQEIAVLQADPRNLFSDGGWNQEIVSACGGQRTVIPESGG
jgi:hypothetical protein